MGPAFVSSTMNPTFEHAAAKALLIKLQEYIGAKAIDQTIPTLLGGTPPASNQARDQNCSRGAERSPRFFYRVPGMIPTLTPTPNTVFPTSEPLAAA
ncbi:translational activator of GCN4 [Paramarasmius palmivorus]|uniref:Translational activator of GCN4 n=1 Tax=Paramarasmius palmivorus TaxID=297713 RepID=A0AAW0APA9_9AGAR